MFVGKYIMLFMYCRDISKNISTIKKFQLNKQMKATALAVKAMLVFKTQAASDTAPLTLKQKLLGAAKVRTEIRCSASHDTPENPSTTSILKIAPIDKTSVSSSGEGMATTSSSVNVRKVASQTQQLTVQDMEGEREREGVEVEVEKGERVGSHGTVPLSEEDEESDPVPWRRDSL